MIKNIEKKNKSLFEGITSRINKGLQKKGLSHLCQLNVSHINYSVGSVGCYYNINDTLFNSFCNAHVTYENMLTMFDKSLIDIAEDIIEHYKKIKDIAEIEYTIHHGTIWFLGEYMDNSGFWFIWNTVTL